MVSTDFGSSYIIISNAKTVLLYTFVILLNHINYFPNQHLYTIIFLLFFFYSHKLILPIQLNKSKIYFLQIKNVQMYSN